MTLADLDLEAEIGRGAQGVVYRARQRSSGAELAVKCFHDRGGSSATNGASRSSTSSAATALRHANLCRVHEVGTDGSTSFVLMDLVRGRTLEDHLAEARDGAARLAHAHEGRESSSRALEAAEIVRQLANGLEHAHARGVVHGDVKPGNVMLDDAGRPVLLDLWSPEEGRGGRPLATPSYAAPEQLTDRPRVDARTDVHGLGVLLYEMVTLERPFRGPTGRSVRSSVAAEPVRVTGAHEVRMGGELSAVVEKALEASPARRYPSAAAFAADLRRYLNGEPVLARRAGVVRRGSRWVVANRALALAIGGIVALAALTAALAVAGATGQRRHADDLRRRSDAQLVERLLERERVGAWSFRPETAQTLADWVELAEGWLGRHGEPQADPRAPTLRAALIRVRSRLTAARRLRARSLGEHAERWSATLAELSSIPGLRGLRLEPIVGLVPIGRDPTSGLLEFVHLPSGTLPERGADGALRLDGTTGIVLVLVPGGSFRMGAERPSGDESPRSPNTDPRALRNEAPVHRVELAPFLVSKFEVTVGQWRRLGGEDASGRTPPWRTDRHPQRFLNHAEATATLGRHGLRLPTEAQWEYAARAGTTSPWWTGWTPDTLDGAGNLADLAFSRETQPALRLDNGLALAAQETGRLDDGHAVPAPVGSFAPNRFGLHDVHGNVMERVRDAFGPYTLPVVGPEGERVGGRPELRIGRGGAWGHGATNLRVSARHETPPESRTYHGCRPVHPLE